MITHLKDIAKMMQDNPSDIDKIFKQYELNEKHKVELEKDYNIVFPKAKQVKKENSTASKIED